MGKDARGRINNNIKILKTLVYMSLSLKCLFKYLFICFPLVGFYTSTFLMLQMLTLNNMGIAIVISLHFHLAIFISNELNYIPMQIKIICLAVKHNTGRAQNSTL